VGPRCQRADEGTAMVRLGAEDKDGDGGDEEQPQGDKRNGGAHSDTIPVVPDS